MSKFRVIYKAWRFSGILYEAGFFFFYPLKSVQVVLKQAPGFKTGRKRRCVELARDT